MTIWIAKKSFFIDRYALLVTFQPLHKRKSENQMNVYAGFRRLLLEAAMIC